METFKKRPTLHYHKTGFSKRDPMCTTVQWGFSKRDLPYYAVDAFKKTRPSSQKKEILPKETYFTLQSNKVFQEETYSALELNKVFPKETYFKPLFN